MRLKVKDLRQFIYGVFLFASIILHIYAIAINSLTPRLISWLLIGITFIDYFFGKGKKEKKHMLKVIWISASFLVVSVIGKVISGKTSLLSTQGMWDVVQPSFFILAGMVFASTVSDKGRRIFYFVSYACLFLSVLYGFTGQNITYDGRYYSIFSNALIYGCFIVICYHLHRYFNKNIYIGIVITIALIYAEILTYSRSGWLSFLVTGVLCAYLSRKNAITRRGIFGIIGVIGVLLVGTLAFSSQIDTVFSYISRVISGRLSNMMQSRSALQRIGSITYLFRNTNPVMLILGQGVGASSYMLSMTTITAGWTGFSSTDNQYLTIVYDYGIIGLYWIIKLCVLDFKALFGEKTKHNKEIFMLASCVLSIMICGFFFEVIGWASLSIVFFSLIGMLIETCHQLNKESTVGGEP